MALYAYSILGVLTSVSGTNIHGTAGCCVADNLDEAIGKAYMRAKETYKTEDGYSNQSVSVVEIPEDWILNAAQEILQEEN